LDRVAHTKKAKERPGLRSQSHPGVEVDRAFEVGGEDPSEEQGGDENCIQQNGKEEDEISFPSETIWNESIREKNPGSKEENRILSQEGRCSGEDRVVSKIRGHEGGPESRKVTD